MVESWVAQRHRETEKAFLPPLFKKYVEKALSLVFKDGSNKQHIVPQMAIALVTTLCRLLEGMLASIYSLQP